MKPSPFRHRKVTPLMLLSKVKKSSSVMTDYNINNVNLKLNSSAEEIKNKYPSPNIKEKKNRYPTEAMEYESSKTGKKIIKN